MPTGQEENGGKGNVSTLAAKYEETVAATDGSSSKPLLKKVFKRLPKGSKTGRNRLQKTPSKIRSESAAE